DRQPDAGARTVGPGMQALEEHEYPLGVLRLDADAVVADGEAPVGAGLPRPAVHPRLNPRLGRDLHARRLLAVEFDRVADQILEDLAQLQAVRHYGRQVIARNLAAGLGDRGAQVG